MLLLLIFEGIGDGELEAMVRDEVREDKLRS